MDGFDTLMIRQKRPVSGKPVGPDSGTNTWQGDQWKIGGGATWAGSPSTGIEPRLLRVRNLRLGIQERPGDNRWSMTVWARDADTGFRPNGYISSRRTMNGITMASTR